MIDLNDLRLFAQVVETGSFSKAALAFNLPVSTVSRRIATLEQHLGVRLFERSTRKLRLTEVGMDIFEHARSSAELGITIESIVSNHHFDVAGVLRISAPPSISDSFLAPIILSFQTEFPKVRVQVFVSERDVDHISEGFDLAFRVGERRDSSLIARRILRYRHRMVASPDYIKNNSAPKDPSELDKHKLIAFSRWTQEQTWQLQHSKTKKVDNLTFKPYLSMNDYAGIILALLAGIGVGELPPIVRPDLLRENRLVEVLPDWRFPLFDLSLVHIGSKQTPKLVRLFKEHALKIGAQLYPDLVESL